MQHCGGIAITVIGADGVMLDMSTSHFVRIHNIGETLNKLITSGNQRGYGDNAGQSAASLDRAHLLDTR